MHLALILIAIVTGFPLGLLIQSETERKRRGRHPPWLPFHPTNPWLLTLGLLIKGVLVAAIMFVPAYLLLKAWGYVPIGKQNFEVFWFVYLLSAAMAKLVRYAYWRIHA